MGIIGEPGSPENKSLEFIKRHRPREADLGASTACLAVSRHRGIPLEQKLGEDKAKYRHAHVEERNVSPTKMERCPSASDQREVRKSALTSPRKKHREASPSKQSRRHESPRHRRTSSNDFITNQPRKEATEQKDHGRRHESPRRRRMVCEEKSPCQHRRESSESKVQVRNSSVGEKEAVLATLFCRRLSEGPVGSSEVVGHNRKTAPPRRASTGEGRHHFQNRSRRKSRNGAMDPERNNDWTLANNFRTQSW